MSDLRKPIRNVEVVGKVTRRRMTSSRPPNLLPFVRQVEPSASIGMELDGRIYRLTVFSPEQWSAMPPADRPAASPMDRPGWYLAMVKVGPIDHRVGGSTDRKAVGR